MAQSGVLTRANIDGILRGLAQRRQNGALEIHLGERSLEVVFFQGKIVDLFERNQPRPWLLFQQLCRVKGWERPAVETCPPEYTGLLELLKSQGHQIEMSELREQLRKLISDEFYLLDPGQGAFYSVRFEMPEFDRDLAAGSTVSGLLLDIAERDEVEKELGRLWEPPAKLQAPSGTEEGEGAVLAACLKEPLGRAELEARSPLSLAVTRRLVLKFINLGCLKPEPAAAEPPPAPEAPKAAEPAATESIQTSPQPVVQGAASDAPQSAPEQAPLPPNAQLEPQPEKPTTTVKIVKTKPAAASPRKAVANVVTALWLLSALTAPLWSLFVVNVP
jgi:hypothetical protein